MSNFDPAWVRSEVTYRADQIRASLVGANATGGRRRLDQVGRLGLRRFGRRADGAERPWS